MEYPENYFSEFFMKHMLWVRIRSTSNERPQHVLTEKYEKVWYFIVGKSILSGAVQSVHIESLDSMDSTVS